MVATTRGHSRPLVAEWPPPLTSALAVEIDVAVTLNEQIVPENKGFEDDCSGQLRCGWTTGSGSRPGMTGSDWWVCGPRSL